MKGVDLMKKIIVMFLCFAILLCLCVPAFAETSFSDIVPGAWYESDVEYTVTKGIFNGVSENEFSPSAPFTRAMFVVALGRLDGIDPVAYNWKVLGDVSPSDWYGPYVAWAYDKAITQSMGNDDFRPDYNVTREQIAAFIVRYLKNCTDVEIKSEKTNYNDASEIASFATESVDVCAALGLMIGDENGNFRPKDGMTRAEAATVIARLDRIVSGDK